MATSAFACYTLDDDTGDWAAHSLDVLTLGPDGITAIVGFLDPSLVTRLGLPPLPPAVRSATSTTTPAPEGRAVDGGADFLRDSGSRAL